MNNQDKQKLNTIDTFLSLIREEFDWIETSKQKDFYGAPWTPELIEKYKDYWDWEYLTDNKSLPWSEELIEKYRN